MVITWPGTPATAQPTRPKVFPRLKGGQPARPSPVTPAQAIPGTQDSPVLRGQKPAQVPVNVPAQPKRKALTPWWEADWAKVASQTAMQRVRLDTTRRDLGKGVKISAVTDMEYSEVVGIDFSQASIQGRIHQIQLSDRPPAPQLHRYIDQSAKDFPVPRLGGSTTTTVQPYVPRNPADGSQVSPGFAANGAPDISHTNVLPVIR